MNRMVIIVGCNHGFQSGRKDQLDDSYTPEQVNDANNQRNCFRNLLHRVINKEKPEIIAEEWGPEDKTFAQILAIESRLRYIEVNTTREEKEQLGIPNDSDAEHHSEAQKSVWNKKREQVMFDKIQHESEGSDPIIVVCGFNHIVGLCNLFQGADDQVKALDCRNEPWYKQGVFGQ